MAPVNRAAALSWLWLTCLMGPLVFMRLDIVPALTVLVALVWAVRRPAVAGALLAVGTMVKLWPAVVASALLGLGRRTVRAALAFAAVVGICLAVIIVTSGGSRVISPLAWQSGRGLMTDSVWASVPMAIRAVNDTVYTVAVSPYQAFEIYGPGVDAWIMVADAATLLAGGALLVLGWAMYRNRVADPQAIAWAATAAVALVISTNKTLSPQYILWLLAPGAVALAHTAPGRRRLLLGAWLGSIALLTHLIYPLFAGMTSTGGPGEKRLLATAVMVLRNVILLNGAVAVYLAAVRMALRFRRHLRSTEAVSDQP